MTAGHYDQRDPRKPSSCSDALREANLALFRTLTPAQWQQHTTHAERGVETIESMLRLWRGTT